MELLKRHGFWALLGILGAFCLGHLALSQGENVSALWIVTAAICIHLTGYRYYSKFLANKVLKLDSQRITPAHAKGDGKDFVPTHKGVLFGHHFAAISGAGPLVGPVLAAQMGFFPGLIWLLVGVVVAGAVQDMVVMAASVRRGGKSLGEMLADEVGPFAGAVARVGILAIMFILIAVLSLVVVKALAHSPWGLFTLAATIPIALWMGLWLRYVRPGRVGEASWAGFAMLLASIWFGKLVADHPYWGPAFTWDGLALGWALILYGGVASVLPVWLLLAPRDYLSTFLKIGTIAALALGIFFVAPELQMPAFTAYTDGSGPVFGGALFPFLFITIACGAISGFHALIASGTTPKMVDREPQVRPIGYGAMLCESFVAVMALVAACALTPGLYFAMNAPAALIGKDLVMAAQTISSWGFVITPEILQQTAQDIGESTVLSRTGGAPTLAVGMAHIMSAAIGGKALMAFWYHFAILFEALFILTTIDAGTRVGRFMTQDLLGKIYAPLGRTENIWGNLLGTALCAGAWGWFLLKGITDPLGGINTLWPLFGIANQMLAGMALILGTTILFKKSPKYVWVTLVPLAWVLTTNLTAAWQKIFSSDVRVGFLALADKYATALEQGKILAPAKNAEEMERIIANNILDAWLAAGLIGLVLLVLGAGIFQWVQALRGKARPLAEEDLGKWSEQSSDASLSPVSPKAQESAS